MFVIDESSLRIDKTSFPTSEEAEQRAAEAARIVGRAINVYELQEGVLNFAFRVLPDGTVEKDNPLSDAEPGDQIEPAAPVALGEAIAKFDQIAEDLESRGDLATANRITAAVQHLVDHKNDGKLWLGVKRSVVAGKYELAEIVTNYDMSQIEVFLAEKRPRRSSWMRGLKPDKVFKGTNKVQLDAAFAWAEKQGADQITTSTSGAF